MEAVLKRLLTIPLLALSLVLPCRAQVQKPLTRTQVDDLVASGLDSESIAKVVDQRGVDFEPTDRYLDVLRSQGAMQVLIDALRAATPAPLTKAQLLKSLAAGTNQDDLVAMVDRRGIDFKPTGDDLDTLRIEGATDKLCQSVQHARQGAPASPGSSGLKGGAPNHIYDVGGDVAAPIAVYSPEPAYSDQARKSKFSGTVQLAIVVNTDGDVADAKVAKPVGHGLDQEAIDTVKTWKFKPATRNGIPVPVRVAVEVTFAYDSRHMPSSPGSAN